jgi:hypothetical protein
VTLKSALVSVMVFLTGSAAAQTATSRELVMRSRAVPEPPRIQFLAPGDFPREVGCAGSPADGSGYVLAWGSAFVVVRRGVNRVFLYSWFVG